MRTRSTTTCSRGDIVLVPFEFSDRPIAKRRPALVISSGRYHASRQDVVIAAITSRIRQPPLFGDHLIKDWQVSGLPKPSVATAIVRTVKRSMLVRRIGSLSARDLRQVDQRILLALGLGGRP